MNLTIDIEDKILIVSVQGRLDAFGAGKFQSEVKEKIEGSSPAGVLIEMAGVDYISSAGIRALLVIFKQLGNRRDSVVLCGLSDYCTDVIKMTGFSDAFPQFADKNAALEFSRKKLMLGQEPDSGKNTETVNLPSGKAVIMPVGNSTSIVDILGDVKDVLYARVTEQNLCSKKFFETEYSIGLGGLGDKTEDYFNVMGEMITIGGTMVWLPTDGHDAADFLIPKTEAGNVFIRTAYNVSITGGFNELIRFKSADPDGVTVAQLYRNLFDLARERRPDYRGVLGTAISAQAKSVLGSGLKKSPVRQSMPSNGKMIMHESNRAEWIESDTAARHTDVTILACGIGACLKDDLSDYDDELLNRVFYIHPVNVGASDMLLHNHAVVFNKLDPAPEDTTDMDQEVRRVVEQGEFLDMRHLLDNSKLTEATIGLSYIQSFRADPGGEPLEKPAGNTPKTVKQLEDYRRYGNGELT